MATKGFNPFLSETDYAAPAAEASGMSNPFLSDFSAPPPVNDNPFFNPFGAPPPPQQQPPPPQQAPSSTNAFLFSDNANSSGGGGGGNPFASFVEVSSGPPSAANGPFSSVPAEDMWGTATSGGGGTTSEPIFMMDTGPDENISLFDSGGDSDNNITGPVRPPHTVPPSTKELLDSVTGQLEATSESLMDRLRLNQPSPVNLAPSPSPSPRSPSPDLFDVLEMPSAPESHPPSQFQQPQQMDNIMDLFDSPIQPQMASGPRSTIDILGLYASNTSQPQPPTTAPPPVPTLPLTKPPLVEETAVGSLVDTTTLTNKVPPTMASIDIDIQQVAPHISQVTTQPQQIISPIASPPHSQTPEIIKSPDAPIIESPPVIPPAPQIPVQPVPPVARAPPPERPKPPPPRSPVHETAKPLPSRPPPPVPPAPRITPQPSPQHHPVPPPQSLPLKLDHPHPPPPIPPAPMKSPVRSPMSNTASPHSSNVDPISIFSAVPPPPPSQPHQSVKSPSPTAVPTVAVVSDFPPQPVAASIFGTTDIVVNPPQDSFSSLRKTKPGVVVEAAFDDFDAKFNSISGTEEGAFGSSSTVVTSKTSAFGDPFGASSTVTTNVVGADDDSAWGASSSGGGGGFGDDSSQGFGGDGFDSFLNLTEPPPVPQSTPAKIKREDGEDDGEDQNQDLAIFIKPRTDGELNFGLAPALAPPPKSPAISTNSAYSEDSSNAFVPFLSSARDTTYDEAKQTTQLNRTDSQETPQTPLFEEDTSQPLEDFPRVKCDENAWWEMHMRHPNKKKITGQRFWKKVFVTLVVQNDVPAVHIYSNKGDKDPFQEIPLQPCYSVSDIGAQQFDQFGKIFTMKIQYIFYKERPGVRPGQISKAGRMADKLSQFAAFAIQGDYQGVKEFGSDLKKLGLPLEHAPQISQLVKLGTQTWEEMKQFSAAVEESLFKLHVHRDRALQYKTEEIQVTLVDENYAEQDVYGVVTKQIARVRLFFLSFLSGVAEVEMGLNDLRRQGKEVVGRHDIIPIATEEWIRTEEIEFSNCVQLDEFEATKTIKFKPPDACYIELLRFRVRPPKHRELPLQVKTVFTTTGCRVEIRSDILVPGFTSRKLGQIPCEDVMVRFPIPECWIYMFRVEKHFRYGSVKSAHRRSGKVKGIERFLGAVEAVEQSLMEVTSGQAKYEHQHRSIVWRIARLPKEGQGAYTTHSFFCHITLQAHEQLPDNLSKHCYVEFTMPHTTVSHTVCRSIAVPNCDEPPEKCVRYLSRHEYVVEIEHTQGFQPATYNLAASTNKEKEKEKEAEVPAPPTDRTDSWFPPEKPKDEDDSDFSD